MTISGDYYHDSSATYKCDKYYVLYGPSTRKCRYGVWDRKAPICKRKTIYLIISHTSLLNYSTQTVIKCPPLKHPKYGNVYITGEYEHDSTASYKCDKYYKIDGPSSRKCRYGEWLGKAPICKRKFHNFHDLNKLTCRKIYSLTQPSSVHHLKNLTMDM